ncbi:unnamed protein product [Caenorhabditis nigoni]
MATLQSYHILSYTNKVRMSSWGNLDLKFESVNRVGNGTRRENTERRFNFKGTHYGCITISIERFKMIPRLFGKDIADIKQGTTSGY